MRKAFSAAFLIVGCASQSKLSPSPEAEWRLIPEATVAGEKRQFFVYGRGLDSAEVTAPAGVKAEKGWVKPDGKVLSVYIAVENRADSADGDKAGAREIKVKTPETSVTFKLKVLDEVPR